MSDRESGGMMKCPTLVLVQKKVLIATGSSTRVRRKMDILSGAGQAIDIVSLHIDAYMSGTGNVVDVGFTFLDAPDTEGLATQTFAGFHERDEMIASWLFGEQGVVAQGLLQTDHHRDLYFNPPLCIVNDISCELNLQAIVATMYVVATVYYYKKSLAKNIILQLLKFYQDARGVFKTRNESTAKTQEDYDT